MTLAQRRAQRRAQGVKAVSNVITTIEQGAIRGVGATTGLVGNTITGVTRVAGSAVACVDPTAYVSKKHRDGLVGGAIKEVGRATGSAVKLVEQAMLERRLARLQGGVAHDDGAFADAIDLYGEYLRTAPEPQDQLPPLVSVLQRFEVLQDMSLALASLGKLQEAYANMDDVERLQKSTGEEVSLKAHGDEGGSRKFLAPIAVDRRLQASVARTLVVRAELELEQSRIQSHRPTIDAEHLSQEAVAILREASASASDLENALNTLGNVHMSLGETSKAEDAYREAVSLAVEDHGKRSPLVAALYHNLASALEGMGKLTEAVKLYTRALDIQLVTLGEANPDTAGSLDSLARCLSKRGLPTEALEAAQSADADSDGKIEWSEFVAAVLPASQEMLGMGLIQAFQAFDKDGDGLLSRDEVHRLLSSWQVIGTHLTSVKTEMIVDELDKSRDGQISFDEFQNYFIKGAGGSCH